jgi:hypothetical protein
MQVILQLEERMSWLEDYLKEAVEKTETMIITSSPETNRTSSADPMEELL